MEFATLPLALFVVRPDLSCDSRYSMRSSSARVYLLALGDQRGSKVEADRLTHFAVHSPAAPRPYHMQSRPFGNWSRQGTHCHTV
jgi:hypothetical protein